MSQVPVGYKFEAHDAQLVPVHPVSQLHAPVVEQVPWLEHGDATPPGHTVAQSKPVYPKAHAQVDVPVRPALHVPWLLQSASVWHAPAPTGWPRWLQSTSVAPQSGVSSREPGKCGPPNRQCAPPYPDAHRQAPALQLPCGPQ